MAPEQKVVLETDPERARAIGRPRVQNPYLGLTNYLSNLRRLGWTDADFADGGSDALIDALALPDVRVPWTQARLAVGLDENVVHSRVDREIRIAYLQLALVAMFVLLTAWFGGERLIVRPIRALVRTAARFGRGDLHVDAREKPWVAEFEPLAAALDDMARKLAAREEELRIANQHLEELASLDGLTGLANRRGFDRQLEREWRRAAERRQPLALMMIDIDHFKLYNDRYGHVTGDACLRAVGETLSLVTLEEAVLVARYGGEEFALLLPGLDLERTAALAEEARKCHRRPPHQPRRSALRPRDHQHRRRIAGAGTGASRPPIWSRPRTVRSTPPSGAVATWWSRIFRCG